jgi:hypothetical protein
MIQFQFQGSAALRPRRGFVSFCSRLYGATLKRLFALDAETPLLPNLRKRTAQSKREVEWWLQESATDTGEFLRLLQRR